ncbi:hypothetical protein POTOM_024634 [Populus tomentosa]|uniref:DUF3741 domain-containing protein n=1 Tax=Populus tomentosa TaxID=118781 RepID=A0A8X7ZFP5_POPTO|nr:hypothetical protein POTOM_024634 [Populus tomentosa]
MAPRSPSLPTGIRRSRSLNSPESFRAQPAPVARLMGLSDIPPLTAAELALAEKRRRLLGALEKCDEDLKALKKIIDAVKSSSVSSTGDDDDDEGRSERGNDLPLLPQPSPVSVLDEFTRSVLSGFSKRYTINRGGGASTSRLEIKKPAGAMSPTSHPLPPPLSTGDRERVPKQQTKKGGGGEDISSIDFLDKIMTREDMIGHGKSHESVVSSPLWSSKAMIESVNEACRDAAWGERREIGRTGLALQDYIFRDLIEEIVKEMGFDCIYQLGPLPFESCKKRLSF